MIALALLACSGDEPLPQLAEVPAFTLQDQTGATVTRDTLLGKVWVADFIFTTCPDICPVLSAHMAEVQARYAGNDAVRLVSLSVDPVTDTPPVLATYAARFGATHPTWLFLTGDIEEMKRVVVGGFKMLMERAVAAETILHGTRFVVVDKKGTIRAYPDPKEEGKKELYAAVDALLKE
ncbi:MAG: SCO family protein [Myxococcota bacterium]